MERCKKPEKPEHMNGDHAHLHQMIEWNKESADIKFKFVYWALGMIGGLGFTILGLLVSVALQI